MCGLRGNRKVTESHFVHFGETRRVSNNSLLILPSDPSIWRRLLATDAICFVLFVSCCLAGELHYLSPSATSCDHCRRFPSSHVSKQILNFNFLQSHTVFFLTKRMWPENERKSKQKQKKGLYSSLTAAAQTPLTVCILERVHGVSHRFNRP